MFEDFNTPDVEEAEDPWGRDLLRELAEIGLKLAKAVQEEAEAQDGKSASDLAMTFARVARAVRQTVALEAKLERDQTVQELRAQIPPREISFQDRMTKIRRDSQRSVVGSMVEELIREQLSDPLERERLFDDLDQLLDTDNPRLDRPIPDLVKDVCQALGLKPAWPKWSKEPWAEKLDLTPYNFEAAQPPPDS